VTTLGWDNFTVSRFLPRVSSLDYISVPDVTVKQFEASWHQVQGGEF